MTISDLLSTEVGITTAFALTWGVAIWGYKQNKKEHGMLGEKVDAAKDEIFQSLEKLSDKIDGVREAISRHEEIWHAGVGTKKKPITKTNKGKRK